MGVVELEFIANDGKRGSHFLVAEQILDAFTKFLKSKKVCVHSPKEFLTVSGVEHFSLQIQTEIPPQWGNSLVSEFLASNPK